MPYIAQDRRRAIVKKAYLDMTEIDKAGELNYAITILIQQYSHNKGKLSYQTINDIIGALEGVKQEFYRRVAVPYEEAKIKENGEVYWNTYSPDEE